MRLLYATLRTQMFVALERRLGASLVTNGTIIVYAASQLTLLAEGERFQVRLLSPVFRCSMRTMVLLTEPSANKGVVR